MKHILPQLPYQGNALEPAISGNTLDFHHNKHHAAYINNLNNLIAGTGFEDMTLEEIIMKAEGGIFNNAAQAWNHTFYFDSLTPEKGMKAHGNLLAAIERKWGTLEKFIEEYSAAAISLFGSGWAWLAKDKTGELFIIKEQNAGNPLRNGFTPILTVDIWEHAYYLDYQNRRADYVKSVIALTNWDKAEERYSK